MPSAALPFLRDAMLPLLFATMPITRYAFSPLMRYFDFDAPLPSMLLPLCRRSLISRFRHAAAADAAAFRRRHRRD